MSRTDEVERVAKALCENGYGNWDAANFNETQNGEEPEEQRDYWRNLARVAIATLDAIRSENEAGQ